MSNSIAECNFTQFKKLRTLKSTKLADEWRVEFVVLPNSESLSKQFENPFCLNMKVDK